MTFQGKDTAIATLESLSKMTGILERKCQEVEDVLKSRTSQKSKHQYPSYLPEIQILCEEYRSKTNDSPYECPFTKGLNLRHKCFSEL